MDSNAIALPAAEKCATGEETDNKIDVAGSKVPVIENEPSLLCQQNKDFSHKEPTASEPSKACSKPTLSEQSIDDSRPVEGMAAVAMSNLPHSDISTQLHSNAPTANPNDSPEKCVSDHQMNDVKGLPENPETHDLLDVRNTESTSLENKPANDLINDKCSFPLNPDGGEIKEEPEVTNMPNTATCMDTDANEDTSPDLTIAAKLHENSSGESLDTVPAKTLEAINGSEQQTGDALAQGNQSVELIPGPESKPSSNEETVKCASPGSRHGPAEGSDLVTSPTVTSAVKQIFSAYRGISDEEQESDTSSDSSSDSESDMKVEGSSGESEDERKKDLEKSDDNRPKDPISSIKTKGELGLNDLPPIASLTITADGSTSLMEIGKVSSIIGPLVVIQSYPGSPALNLESVLFLEGRKSMGQVFETFGPVVNPYYSVRYNSQEEIEEKEITVGTPIFFAPKTKKFTQYVFLSQLQQMKGSDASWENNNEPPEKFLDYSDDEQERSAKNKKKRGKNKRAHDQPEGEESEEEADMCQLPGAVIPRGGRRPNQRSWRGSQGEGRGRGRWPSVQGQRHTNPSSWPSGTALPQSNVGLTHRLPGQGPFPQNRGFRSQRPPQIAQGWNQHDSHRPMWTNSQLVTPSSNPYSHPPPRFGETSPMTNFAHVGLEPVYHNHLASNQAMRPQMVFAPRGALRPHMSQPYPSQQPVHSPIVDSRFVQNLVNPNPMFGTRGSLPTQYAPQPPPDAPLI